MNKHFYLTGLLVQSQQVRTVKSSYKLQWLA